MVPVINYMLTNVPFDLVVYSYDWHPSDHISFYDNHKNRKVIASRNQLDRVLDQSQLDHKAQWRGHRQSKRAGNVADV